MYNPTNPYKMKRIRCPKCDEPIVFDKTRYEDGQVLVFECPACHHQFRIKIRAKKKNEDAATEEQETEKTALGTLIILENAFQLSQELPLYEGNNVIGRHVRGTKANCPIKTVDPSIDTTHCVINVKTDRSTGKSIFSITGGPSGTGTFLHNNILGVRERALLEDGDIITIGASTLILRLPETE